MEIILTQDVPNVGRKYEIKTVKPGYGQNFLIKRGLAYNATPKNISKVASQKSKHDAVVKAREEALLANVASLESVTLKLKGKANEKGHLFAGVDQKMIVSALKDQANLEFDADHVVMKKHLKEIGEHEVLVKVGDKEARVKVSIESEE